MTRNYFGIPAGKSINQGRAFVRCMLLIAAFVFLPFDSASGTIPDAERTVLVNIYNATNGPSWTQRTGWNGAAGTECSWYGVTCDAGSNRVITINLSFNNLIGGPLPDFSNLTNLLYFYVNNNQLTGSIDLNILPANLENLDLSFNQLTGSLPSLAGLTHLLSFSASNNQLTGSVPSLSGTNLLYFNVASNQLTGSIPPLSGTSLQTFDVSNNQLTGSIPSLTELIGLQRFSAFNNQLTGSIPSLSGLTSLQNFDVSNNQLTGSIPSLSGLTALLWFYVGGNRLTGSIPSLSGLTSLLYFYAGENQLTGSIPSLSGLSALQSFNVSYNELSGDVPSVPSPTNSLIAGASLLCPNDLNLTTNSPWDTATGNTPWYQNCIPYSITYDGNGNTGGSVPDDSTAHPTESVNVPGNTGALYKNGYRFAGWNTDINGNGVSYVGGDALVMSAAPVILYAQWTPQTGSAVRIAETLAPYSDIQFAYDAPALDGQTILARSGLGNDYIIQFDRVVSVKLKGGYDDAAFTNDTGATLVIGGVEVISGSVEVAKIIIQ